MTAASVRYALVWLGVAVAIAIALSVLLSIPYIYSVLGISGFVVAGHLVTIDDDAPGGWSNPDQSKRIWTGSLMELLAKFAVLVALLVLLVAFPEIKEYGA